MPTTYACDNCHLTSETLDNWLLVSVAFMHWVPNYPAGTSGRTLDATSPDLLFHERACLEAWCTKAELTPPPAP
jgi:hypothetical protein